MSDIRGVSLDRMVEPIRTALAGYAETTKGAVDFDITRAAKLSLTPEKPYSARSASPVRYLGEIASTLFVIVFAPDEGSGDTFTDSAAAKRTGLTGIPTAYGLKDQGIAPRSKNTSYAEIYLPLVSFPIDRATDPKMYAGQLSLYGIDPNIPDPHIRELAKLGQARKLTGLQPDYPRTTLTVGYHGDLGDNIVSSQKEGLRFGDPHAIYDHLDGYIQVCAFLAIESSMAKQHRSLLNALKPHEPSIHK